MFKLKFLIVSFPKTGTTSLDKTFRQHPEVCLPLRKETWFFEDVNFKKGIDWYEKQFPQSLPAKSCCGEITTTVLLQDNFLEKIKKVIPDGKIIVLLRDPIKRCLSHYYHSVRLGKEIFPLEKAISEENKRLLSKKYSYTTYAYAAIGSRYFSSIKNLLAAYPRKQIKFVLFEELIKNSEDVISDLYKFIGVSPLKHSLARENMARMPKNKFLKSILELPGKFLSLYPSVFIRRLTPKFIERKICIFRHKIHRAISELPELSYKEFETPPMPPKLAQNLADKYNKELKGLDKFINKPIADYWKWYNS